MKRKVSPFSISPNPVSLYLTPGLEAAAHRIHYTVEHRQGLTAVLGEVGTGKSSIIRRAHAEYDAMDDVTSILIPYPSFSTEFGMIGALANALELPPRKSVQQHQRELEAFLAEQFMADRVVVLFIDEAQKLSHRLLELVRALLNYETDDAKLIQIVLAGQLELRDRLLTEKQKPLYTRLTMPSILAPLSPSEVEGVVAFRCEYAKIINPFSKDALYRIYELTYGVPREVLRLCSIAHEMQRLAGAPDISVTQVDSAFQEMQLRDAENGDGE
jgi:general secretion pathway protein A